MSMLTLCKEVTMASGTIATQQLAQVSGRVIEYMANPSHAGLQCGELARILGRTALDGLQKLYELVRSTTTSTH